MISKQFEILQAGHESCLAVALADMSSRTVFLVSARKKQKQERFDALCAAAADIFLGETGTAHAAATGAADRSALAEVTVQTADEVWVLLRAPWEPVEVVMAICTAEVELERFLADARTRLARIAAAA